MRKYELAKVLNCKSLISDNNETRSTPRNRDAIRIQADAYGHSPSSQNLAYSKQIFKIQEINDDVISSTLIDSKSNRNATIEDSLKGTNDGIPATSDHEDISNDINYDSSVTSDDEDTNNDINYDSPEIFDQEENL